MSEEYSYRDANMSAASTTLPPYGLHTPQELADLADLHYVTDDIPGIGRRRCGRGFVYLDPSGRRLTNLVLKDRIETLAIPPAWTEVWICPDERGHLQATGRDEKGRKQYLYHPRWSEASNRTKFERLLPFGEKLPRIRRRVRRDLALKSLSRPKVVAAVIDILDRTLIRIGNREYADDNESFGATTLTEDHVTIRGSLVRFQFRGKGGKQHDVCLRDRRLARIIHRCEEIPGQPLFQFCDEDGEYRVVESSDVNEWLQEVTGEQFTAKDFRTWRGTSIVTGLLSETDPPPNVRQAKQSVTRAIRETAQALGNTPTVCRKYYADPHVIELFLSGDMPERRASFRPSARSELDCDEQFLLHLLKYRHGGPP
jgi:DNA topoisomerase I